MTFARCLAAALGVAVAAQAQEITLPHAGRVLAANDAPIEGNTAFRFRLFGAPEGGSASWDSGSCTLPVTAGYYSVELGDGCGLPFTVTGDAWLEVSIGPVALAPRLLLPVVARAHSAATAARLGGELPAYYLDAQNLTGTLPAATLPLASASERGAIGPADKAKLDTLAAGGSALVLGATRPSPAADGTFVFNTTTRQLEVRSGGAWSTFVPVADSLFTLPFDGSAANAAGQLAFTTTAVTQYDATNRASGTHSLTANIYTGSPADYALESAQPLSAFSLHPSEGDWEFEWDYRQTDDNGYGLVHFATNTQWIDVVNTYVRQDGGETLPAYGWIFGSTWGLGYMFFSTPAGKVQWSYGTYHASWKHLRLRKVGTQLTLYADGTSLGARTIPTITDPTARRLYVFGSPNGGNPSYVQASQLSPRSQIDNLSFRKL